MNLEFLKEFILNTGQPSKSRVQKEAPEVPQQEGQTTQALIQYRELNIIFDTSLIEGTTSKKKTIYVNEARKAVLAGPPSTQADQSCSSTLIYVSYTFRIMTP